MHLRFGKLGRSGTAIIEFALVAPLLIMLLLGIADLAPSLMVRFKVGTATQAVADLAAQTASISPSDIPNLFGIGGDVVSPFAAAPLIQRISNIASDGRGNTFVYWSCGESSVLAPLPARSAVTAPAGMISTQSNGTDTSYIMVESQYIYNAPANYIIRRSQTISIVAYTLPRVSTYIGSYIGSLAASPTYVPTRPSAVRTTSTDTTNGVNTSY